MEVSEKRINKTHLLCIVPNHAYIERYYNRHYEIDNEIVFTSLILRVEVNQFLVNEICVHEIRISKSMTQEFFIPLMQEMGNVTFRGCGKVGGTIVFNPPRSRLSRVARCVEGLVDFILVSVHARKSTGGVGIETGGGGDGSISSSSSLRSVNSSSSSSQSEYLVVDIKACKCKVECEMVEEIQRTDSVKSDLIYSGRDKEKHCLHKSGRRERGL